MIQYLQNMPEYVSGFHVSISARGGRDNDTLLDQEFFATQIRLTL